MMVIITLQFLLIQAVTFSSLSWGSRFAFQGVSPWTHHYKKGSQSQNCQVQRKESDGWLGGIRWSVKLGEDSIDLWWSFGTGNCFLGKCWSQVKSWKMLNPTLCRPLDPHLRETIVKKSKTRKYLKNLFRHLLFQDCHQHQVRPLSVHWVDQLPLMHCARG